MSDNRRVGRRSKALRRGCCVASLDGFGSIVLDSWMKSGFHGSLAWLELA